MRFFKYSCLALALVLLSVPAYASLITFSSAGAFNSAAPGLPVETFEAGLVAAGSVTVCSGPLSSSAASACFPLGGLLPGVVYSASGVAGMALLGAGFDGVGNASKVLGPNAFADTFDLTFAAATAAGFNVFPGPTAGNILISVFDRNNLALGAFTVSGVLGGSFFGVLSTTDQIGRINIASQSSLPGELIDNLAFGTPVPEPASLLLFAGGLAILFPLRFLRKRNRN